MWTITTNMHHLDNGLFVEMQAQHIQQPGEMPMVPPATIRRIFTHEEDAIAFIQDTLINKLSPKNMDQTIIDDAFEALDVPDKFNS